MLEKKFIKREHKNENNSCKVLLEAKYLTFFFFRVLRLGLIFNNLFLSFLVDGHSHIIVSVLESHLCVSPFLVLGIETLVRCERGVEAAEGCVDGGGFLTEGEVLMGLRSPAIEHGHGGTSCPLSSITAVSLLINPPCSVAIKLVSVSVDKDSNFSFCSYQSCSCS